MHIRKGQVLINARRRHLRDLGKGNFRNNLESFCLRKLGVSQGHSHSYFLSTLTSGFRIPDSKIPFSSPASPLNYRFLYSVAPSTFLFVHLIRSYTHHVQSWYFDFSHQTSFAIFLVSVSGVSILLAAQTRNLQITLVFCFPVQSFGRSFWLCVQSMFRIQPSLPCSVSPVQEPLILSRSAAGLCPLTFLELHSSSSSQWPF